MNISEFKKLVANYTEENIITDEPHVIIRCKENNTTLEKIKQMLLNQSLPLIRIIEDRPKVYKLYYKARGQTEWKIVIDLLTYNKINIRTVKKLSRRFRLGIIQNRRF